MHIYIYVYVHMCLSLLAPVSAVSFFACDIKSGVLSKKATLYRSLNDSDI